MLDSRVTLGAAAKGRSSSYSISKILKQSLPYVLGSNLYPGGLHVYSAKNGPSRDCAIPAPTKDLPIWYTDLLAGNWFVNRPRSASFQLDGCVSCFY